MANKHLTYRQPDNYFLIYSSCKIFKEIWISIQ